MSCETEIILHYKISIKPTEKRLDSLENYIINLSHEEAKNMQGKI